MATPTINSRPEATVNGILSRWNAANLPLQYEIENTKWPANSDDLTDTIGSISNSNGYAQLNLSTSNETYTAKLWVVVTGTTSYNGVHRVRAATPTTVTIDFPASSSEAGTVQIYYQNYTTLIRVYAGLDPAHDYAAENPMTLIGTIEQRPDTDNVTYVDVRNYVKAQLNLNWDETQTSWPNDLNIWCDFYISVAERYDSVSGAEVIDFTSSYTDDTVYCHAIHGALQFGSPTGGNMGEYVATTSVYKEANAKWMTFFERPKIIDYNEFYLSVIIEDPEDLELLIEEYDINSGLIDYAFTSIADQDYGVYRIPVEYLFTEETSFATAQLLSGLYNELTDIINIDVDVSCAEITEAPINLEVEVVSRSSMQGSFTDTSGGTANHQVYYSISPDSGFVLLDVLDPGETTFTQSGLSFATTYYYKVRAIRDGVTSQYSNTASLLIDGFFTDWATSNTSTGSSNSDQVKLPLVSGGTYDFVVQWGDGTSDHITAWNQTEVTHTYSSPGTYEVDIVGTIEGWRFNNTGDRLKLLEILRWGGLALVAGDGAGCFYGCSNMEITATDELDISAIITMQDFMRNCSSLTTVPGIGNWDTTGVTSMQHVLAGCTNFNSSVDGWDVSAVTTLNNAFLNCVLFNQNLNSWNTVACTNFVSCFNGCTAFNGNVSGWDVSGASSMNSVFTQCVAFNQNVNSWDVSNCTTFVNTFNNCQAFNQPLDNWFTDLSTSFAGMFSNCFAFNQNITGWNTGNANNMQDMLENCSLFNQAIGVWNVANVTNMSEMLRNCSAFNQSLAGWNVTNASRASLNLTNMLSNCGMSTANYDATLIGWEAQGPITGVALGATGLTYTSAGAGGTARASLVGTYSWVITGDSGV